MIEIINEKWKWMGVTASSIVNINDFGNVIFKSETEEYWRICPEELYCEKIASTEAELNDLFNNADFQEDWEMTRIVEIAFNSLGELDEGQKYCLKLPGVFGGKYEPANMGKISHHELISFAGYMSEQIKDLPDGSRVKLNVNLPDE